MLQQAVVPPASPIPFWVPTLLACLFSAAVSFLIARWHQRRTEKRLTYEYSTARISSVNSHRFSGRLKILFDDEPVPRAALVRITVRNIGTAYIQKTDFGSDMQFKFEGTDINVLSAEVSTKLKDVPIINYGPDVGNGREITVAPVLLNSSAEFSILALVSNGDAEITAHASIAGLTRIENKTTLVDFSLMDRLQLVMWGIGFVAFLGLLLTGRLSINELTITIVCLLLVVFLSVVRLGLRSR